jgi:glycerophosphoryl diester phosphodiesterase
LASAHWPAVQTALASGGFLRFLEDVAQPLIIAHRGASADHPENTRAAFQAAIDQGADAIELDVRATADGVPVVCHDENLLRLTGESRTLSASRWRHVRRLRIRDGEEIPRLDDVLRDLRGRIVVQIEVKPGVPMEPVIRAVKRTRASEGVILASFSAVAVREAAALAPAVPRMCISHGEREPASLVRQLAACAAGGLSVDYRSVRSADWVRCFRSRGYLVWSWTVNETAVARRLAKWGVDGIMGDNPALLRRVV